MAYDVNNLTPESRKKIMIVLKDIRIKSEIRDRKRFLFFNPGKLRGVSEDEHDSIILTLIGDGIVKENKWISYFTRLYQLQIDEPFFIFYDKVKSSLEENVHFVKPEKKIKTEVMEALRINENTKWKDIAIRFLNDHDVEIRANGKSYSSNYEKMGFADKRKSAKQEKQTKGSWKILQYFSVNNNFLPLDTMSPDKKDKLKKHRQELSKILKIYFSITDDPILYEEDKKQYKLKIQTIPEKLFQDDFRDRNIYKENSP